MVFTLPGGQENYGKKPERNAAQVAPSVMSEAEHISDHDLERYHLGMVAGEAELAELEEHLLSCGECTDRAKSAGDYVDAVRAAACERTD